VAHKKRRIQVVIILIIFVVYFLVAARPVPKEIVLVPKWISSLPTVTLSDNAVIEGEESGIVPVNVSGQLLPFTLGSSFGYIDSSGQFAINRLKKDDIYLSRNMWTEYGPEPANIAINNLLENSVINIENARGYPILLDNRVFILGSEQNSLSEIDKSGNVKWTYEFGAPLTSIDANAGLVLTGSLDGIVEVFDSEGRRIFYFEPGGSKYSVILGCAISRNGSRIGIICGIDKQRFLLFERFGSTGGEYRIVYHEFLETGFRRPVRILFVDEDQRIVFERENGIGCYSIKSRRGMYIPLDGEIAAIDESGEKGFFFLVTSAAQGKNLVGIKFPPDRLFGLSGTAAKDTVFMKAPFKSDDVFLGRQSSGSGSMLVTGGGTTLISFSLEEN